MTDPSDPRIPRPALLGAIGLVLLALVAAGTSRLLGLGHVEPPASEPVASRDLRFTDRTEGGIAVFEADSDALVEVILPGQDGFIRGVMRGLARDRAMRDLGREEPFRLVRWADGRLSLEDTATGQRIELVAFGHTNEQAFDRLLTAPVRLR